MSCTVCIWDYQGTKSAFGHAAVSVDGGDPSGNVYVSWWPDCSPGAPDSSTWDSKRREYFGMCEPHRSRKLADDITAEFGKQPDKTVVLDGLDESAMKSFWADLTSDPRAKWSASTTNCAAAVAAALRAGGSDKYFNLVEDLAFDIFDTNWWAWTPKSVYLYSVNLSNKLKAKAA